jgi:amino acid permease
MNSKIKSVTLVLPHQTNPRHPLLRRERHVSIETLSPHSDCRTRKSTFLVALFNLVATVCGGGVLSLPLVFARAGIIPTTILMIYGAISTDAALQRLVDAARTNGSRSYGDVAQAAFGKAAQIATTATLALMLCGSLIAYQVLTRDVWAPVLFRLIPSLQVGLLRLVMVSKGGTYDVLTEEANPVDRDAADLLLLGILVLGMPLLLKKDLHALRHACYVGFGSCITLMTAVIYRALQRVGDGHGHPRHLRWWSSDPQDWLFGFPIVVLCFFCSYNVLPVHSQLFDPSRKRIGWILRASMMLCFVLFYAVGLAGYVYAFPHTPDNILTAFPIEDSYIMAGRMGYCLTLLFGLPLILMPCREAVLSVPAQIRDWQMDQALIAEYKRKTTSPTEHFVVNGVDFDEPYVAAYGTRRDEEADRGGGSSKADSTSIETMEDLGQLAEYDVRYDDDGRQPSVPPPLPMEACECPDETSHLLATVGLLGITYATAISVPGVAAVWSVCGSSMALWIAFCVPTACYIQIRRHKGLTRNALEAWVLLFVSVMAMVVCTHAAVSSALRGDL